MKTIQINKADYSCKKMKEMEGHDGYIIRFDLHHKKIKVAEVFDDGNGGMVDIDWVAIEEKELFASLVESMGEYEFYGEMSKYNDEVLVMEIYEDARLGNG